MFHKSLMAAAACAAIVVAGPAVAQRHGGGQGGPRVGAGAGATVRGPSMTMPSANVNSQATLNSQGPANASINGISHASSNSVLARGAVSSSTLPGLKAGLTVNNSTGTSIGTVSQVVTGTDGSIRAVVVTSPTGRTIRLAPSTLSISGNVVTTTSTMVGG